jgi:hypothetical protein
MTGQGAVMEEHELETIAEVERRLMEALLRSALRRPEDFTSASARERCRVVRKRSMDALIEHVRLLRELSEKGERQT